MSTIPRAHLTMRVLGVAAVLFVLALATASPGSAAAPERLSGARTHASAPHLMAPIGHRNPTVRTAASCGALMCYQSAGAPIESAAAVYLVFWGVQWQTGWTDVSTSGRTYTSGQAMTYISDFFKNVGGSAWNGSQTQYCSGVAVGSTSCGTAGTHVGNGNIYGGSWVDPSVVPPAVPDNCAALVCLNGLTTTNLLAQEAIRAANHFGSINNPNANYMILLPKATLTPGYGVYCAYHSEVVAPTGQKLAFTNMPYVPDLPLSCGANFVNQDNAYGNGWFDGYSIVAGHEFAEAETDPFPGSNPAWRDGAGQENGDKCAWIAPGTPGGTHNITLPNGHFYAVQTLWSNSAAGCV